MKKCKNCDNEIASWRHSATQYCWEGPCAIERSERRRIAKLEYHKIWRLKHKSTNTKTIEGDHFVGADKII